MSKRTKVADEGQTTIPQKVRGKYRIEPGDEVEWIEGDGALVLQKVADDRGRGMLVDNDVPRAKREEIAEALSEDVQEMERRNRSWNEQGNLLCCPPIRSSQIFE